MSRTCGEAIKRGEGSLNGDTIKFAVSGRLLDGQHRLEACVAAGQPIVSVVVEGLEDTVMSTIDIGTKRRASDALSIAGKPDNRLLADAATWVFRIIRGAQSVRFRHPPTVVQLVSIVDEYPELQSSLAQVHSRNFNKTIGFTAMFTAIHALASHSMKAEANEFIEQLGSGVGFESTEDPILKLRQMMLRMKAEKVRKRVEPWNVYGCAVKAWNAYVAGEQIGVLRMAEFERWPVIAGAQMASEESTALPTLASRGRRTG